MGAAARAGGGEGEGGLNGSMGHRSPHSMPAIDWTVMLTVFTCVGIVASLGILAFLVMSQSHHHGHHGHHDSSSSDEDKLVPVAVTIMPPNQGNYAVQQTNWQQWEPASLQQRPPGAVSGVNVATTVLG